MSKIVFVMRQKDLTNHEQRTCQFGHPLDSCSPFHGRLGAFDPLPQRMFGFDEHATAGARDTSKKTASQEPTFHQFIANVCEQCLPSHSTRPGHLQQVKDVQS
jgi:hypothetical protein